MERILHQWEEYLSKKLSHLFFEIMEYPQKKDILYIGLCYCQLSRVYGLNEIPLEGIKDCLRKYLIDFENYPWRDYLLELELFYLREDEDRLIRGTNLMKYFPSKEATISIDPRYSFLKDFFCQKIYRYWYISRKLEGSLHSIDAKQILKNSVVLFNEGLYREMLTYLEDYLPYLKEGNELLLFRLLRHLAIVGELLERRNYKKAYEEINKILEFLKDFRRELKLWPYDLKKLQKDLNKLKKTLKRNKFIYLPPLKVVEKRKTPWWRFLFKFLKG